MGLFLRALIRDVAQLVEYTSGGRVVAGSSPVIPTKKKDRNAILYIFIKSNQSKSVTSRWSPVTSYSIVTDSSLDCSSSILIIPVPDKLPLEASISNTAKPA
jgi:hypothetical protein